MRLAHDMPFGAQLDDGGVRFGLWAPAQQQPRVQILAQDAVQHELPMTAGGHGWFGCSCARASAGALYRFRLDDGSCVPDPASRFQPQGVQGPSQVIDARAYRWQNPDWRGRPWHEVVLYELHVGAFGGVYSGVERRLDHLARLGISALELMPLAAFAGARGWGYDGVLPFAPHAAYGTPQQLKQLVDAAHERELMVFLDVVYNHFGPEGNHLARYAPQFFTARHRTPWGDAIDFSQRAVRDFYIHNALYWLQEYCVDGLRLDAVHAMVDDGEPTILHELARAVRRRFPARHVHLVLENDGNAAHLLHRGTDGAALLYDAQWNDDFHHVAHVLATGEREGYYADYQGQVTGQLGKALARGFVYQGEPAPSRGMPRGEDTSGLPPLAFVNFLQNHDQVGNRALGERLTVLARPEVVQALCAVWLLAPSIPLLFMGQEWGTRRPFLYFCDFDGELANAVRNGRRQEFARFAAFSDPQAAARIPDPNAAQTYAASCLDWSELAQPQHAEQLGFMRELLALRQQEIVPRLEPGLPLGDARVIEGGALCVRWRLAGGTRLTLRANLGDAPLASAPLPPQERLLYALPPTHDAAAAQVLPPWSVRWSLQ